MIEALPLILSAAAGLLAGAFFFGALWLTVVRLSDSNHPARLFILSNLIRFPAVLGVFYFVGRGHADRLIACLVGFTLARLLANRLISTKPSKEVP